MAFDSFSAFMVMEGHGPYVWSCYAAFFLLMIGLMVWSLRRRKAVCAYQPPTLVIQTAHRRVDQKDHTLVAARQPEGPLPRAAAACGRAWRGGRRPGLWIARGRSWRR